MFLLFAKDISIQRAYLLVATSSNHRLMSAFEFSYLQVSFCVVKHYFKIMEEIMN